MLASAVALGLALLAATGGAGTAWAQGAPAMPGSMTWDVRNGDQQGKLMLNEATLSFESLTDAKHSRNWKLAEIREISKKGRKDMRVRPMKGSTYDFQLKDGKLRDEIYGAISARVVAARQAVRK